MLAVHEGKSHGLLKAEGLANWLFNIFACQWVELEDEGTLAGALREREGREKVCVRESKCACVFMCMTECPIFLHKQVVGY